MTYVLINRLHLDNPHKYYKSDLTKRNILPVSLDTLVEEILCHNNGIIDDGKSRGYSFPQFGVVPTVGNLELYYNLSPKLKHTLVEIQDISSLIDKNSSQKKQLGYIEFVSGVPTQVYLSEPKEV